jgi:hypothetical protein
METSRLYPVIYPDIFHASTRSGCGMESTSRLRAWPDTGVAKPTPPQRRHVHPGDAFTLDRRQSLPFQQPAAGRRNTLPFFRPSPREGPIMRIGSPLFGMPATREDRRRRPAPPLPRPAPPLPRPARRLPPERVHSGKRIRRDPHRGGWPGARARRPAPRPS